jgi:hypothetical protein
VKKVEVRVMLASGWDSISDFMSVGNTYMHVSCSVTHPHRIVMYTVKAGPVAFVSSL